MGPIAKPMEIASSKHQWHLAVLLAAVIASLAMCSGVENGAPEDVFDEIEFDSKLEEAEHAMDVQRAHEAATHLPSMTAIKEAAEHTAAKKAVSSAVADGVSADSMPFGTIQRVS